MPTTSTAVLFGIDYRDKKGALAHIQAADIKSFQEGNLLLPNTSAVQPDKATLP
jgi:hypothetical protein